MQDSSRGSGGAFLTTTSASSTNSSSFYKLHKPSNYHKHKKGPQNASRDSTWETSKASKDPSGRPRENQPLQDINSKIGFKESNTLSKDPQAEDEDLDPGLSKGLSRPDGQPTKKQKKGFAVLSGRVLSDLDARRLEKKVSRDAFQTRRLRQGRDHTDRRMVPSLPPFQELVDPNDSEMEDPPRSDVSRRSSGFGMQQEWSRV